MEEQHDPPEAMQSVPKDAAEGARQVRHEAFRDKVESLKSARTGELTPASGKEAAAYLDGLAAQLAKPAQRSRVLACLRDDTGLADLAACLEVARQYPAPLVRANAFLAALRQDGPGSTIATACEALLVEIALAAPASDPMPESQDEEGSESLFDRAASAEDGGEEA